MSAIPFNRGCILKCRSVPYTPATAYAQDGCDVNYSLTDLRALESGYSASEDINDRGEIVGYSLTEDFEARAGSFGRREKA